MYAYVVIWRPLRQSESRCLRCCLNDFIKSQTNVNTATRRRRSLGFTTANRRRQRRWRRQPRRPGVKVCTDSLYSVQTLKYELEPRELSCFYRVKTTIHRLPFRYIRWWLHEMHTSKFVGFYNNNSNNNKNSKTMFTVLSSWQSHWLPVKQRVEYKLCMMIHRCLYTATHHRTWRTWSRRRPLQLSDLVSDLPHPVWLQCHELWSALFTKR